MKKDVRTTGVAGKPRLIIPMVDTTSEGLVPSRHLVMSLPVPTVITQLPRGFAAAGRGAYGGWWWFYGP